MRRLIALSFAALAAASAPAHAWIGQKGGPPPAVAGQMLLGTTAGSMSTVGNRFYPVGYSATAVTSDFKSLIFPFSATITGIRFEAKTPPVAGTLTATLYKNGVATALTCQVTSSSSPAGICSGTGSVSFAAGDWASYQVSPGSTPTASAGSAAFVMIPSTANDTVIPAVGSAFSTTATNAAHPFATGGTSTAAFRRNSVFPDGGTVSRFYVSSTDPSTASSYYDFSPGKNGVATSVTCRVDAGTTSCNDTTNSFSVAALDDFQFQGTPSATAPTSATASFGARYVPTTSGSYPLMSIGQGTNDNATTDVYFPVGGGNAAGNATEATTQNITDAQTFTKIAIKLANSPGLAGSGKKRTFVLRVNGVDSSLTCDVVETATTASCTGSVTVADNDKIATVDRPTNSPNTGAPAISYLAHR